MTDDTLLAELAEALREAAATFRKYEKMHNDKGTVDGAQKAAANASCAKRCEAAISKYDAKMQAIRDGVGL